MRPTAISRRRRRPAAGPILRAAPPLVAALVALAAPRGAEAQSWRVQGAWVAGHVGGAVVGAEVRHPLGPEPELPRSGEPGAGPVEMTTRDWMLTGMLAGGLNIATPEGEDDVQPLVYGHGGVLYRTGSSVLSRAGVVGVVYVPAGAVGTRRPGGGGRRHRCPGRDPVHGPRVEGARGPHRGSPLPRRPPGWRERVEEPCYGDQLTWSASSFSARRRRSSAASSGGMRPVAKTVS